MRSFRSRLSEGFKKSKPIQPSNAGPQQPSQTPIPSSSASRNDLDDRSTARDTAINVFKLALGTLSAASGNVPVPGLKPAIDTLLTIMNNVQKSMENAKGFLELADRMERLQPILSSMHGLEGAGKASISALNNLEKALETLKIEIREASSHGKLVRFFNSTDDASSLVKHTDNLDKVIRELNLAVSIDTNRGVTHVQNEMKSLGAVAISSAVRDRFNTLTRVVEAAYNSSARESATGCLIGTRVDILDEIHDWVRTDGTLLFWLNGVAGTGKSTIAHSIASAYDRETSRGASFFFSRDQEARRETKCLFQTIAFQLGNAYPALKVEIAKALEDQTILSSKSQRQLQKLILEPISNLYNSFSSPIVIVLDALDECEEEDAVSYIIELLVIELAGRNLPLKFFVTSRPETHLCSTFQSPQIDSKTHPFVLHDVELSHVQHDIHVFVQHGLKQMADRCREVLENRLWPEEHEVEALVTVSAGLFIAAATALKFISPVRGSRDPRDRLRMILDSTKGRSVVHSRAFQYLDNMYAKILENATSGEQPSDVFERFRTIVGTIVLAYSRLSIRELAGLLQMEGKVRPALADLQSVILVPKGDGAVRAFHLSFHDYLTTRSRCANDNFFIDPPLRHAEIARLCLERMMRSLKRDICDIRDHTKLNSEVHGLDEKKAEYLSGDLQYACKYWALHLSECFPVGSLFELVRSFAFASILHWIEALSLIGELGGGIRSLREAQAKLSLVQNPPDGLLELLRDTERFLFDFYDGINTSALHVYHSALLFTPKATLLYRTFVSNLKGTPELVRGVDDTWNACLRTMEGHSSGVRSVAISSDGTCVISGSNDNTIRIWDAQTGATLHQLEGHSRGVTSVAISHNGARVFSGSVDNTIRIWDTGTGAALRELKGHSGSVRSVAISHDGSRVVSGSDDHTVRIWDAHTGAILHKLDAHTDWVRSVAISYDSTLVVSGSNDETIRIWDAQTGRALNKLTGHSRWVRSVAISRDGTRIVSGSVDCTICIWDTGTGVVLHRLGGHSDWVLSVAISHDGKRIVSGSNDNTILVWDTQTGTSLYKLAGHSEGVASVAISNDGAYIISGSDDNTIRIWDTQTGAASHGLDRHSGPVKSLAISHDGSRVISGSNDNDVRIWDAHTGMALRRLRGHSRGIMSIAISQDDTRIVSGSSDNTVYVWNAQTGAALHKLTGHMSWVRSVAISYDGTRVVSGSVDNTIRIWDIQTGVTLHQLEGHSRGVTSVAISYDGAHVVSGSIDNTIRIWNARMGTALYTLGGHSDWVVSVAVSHDGTRVVSSSNDKTVRIWDTQTGAFLHMLDGFGTTPDARFGLDETCIVTHSRSFPIPPHARPLSPLQTMDHLPSYSLQDGWLVEDGTRLTWVPPAYRGTEAASPPLIVFGTPSGEVVILRLPPPAYF